MLLLLALAACTPDDPAKDDTSADTGADTDTGTDTDDTDTDDTADTDAPRDLDGDGVSEDEDCDDRDPDVLPGADEVWNSIDDDCDGVVDADGTWTGEVTLRASAVYEGRRYDFSLACPFAGTRAEGTFDWSVTCTPDPDDAMAQLLLGATLSVTPQDTDVDGETWDDRVEFTSANGWDSNGDGTITWSSFDRAEVAVSMGGVSLTASGTGTVRRE